MTNAEFKLADALLSHQLDLLRLGSFAQEGALGLLDSLGAELEGMLRSGDLTAFNRARVTKLLAQATEVIDRYYSTINAATGANVSGVAGVQPSFVARALAIVSLEASLPSTTTIAAIVTNALVEGAKSGDWWRRQAGDVKFRFAAAVRQGIVAGETNEAIVRRVVGTAAKPGVMTTARSNARILVHASIQQAANDARLASFRENGDVIKGVRQLSTLDSHTTDICLAYSGGEWDLEGNPINGTTLPFNGGPPRHWGCRSVLVPITKTFKELGLNIPEFPASVFASAEGPTKLTMKQWIDTRTAEQLDEQLGKGRAQMYRSGKITLQQLLDLRGNPLTLAQLERKYK